MEGNTKKLDHDVTVRKSNTHYYSAPPVCWIVVDGIDINLSEYVGTNYLVFGTSEGFHDPKIVKITW